MQEQYRVAACVAAKAHGIDVDNPENGKWNLDPVTLTFNRTG